ncbi:hypothetical protein PILCRDRAFT_787248, partial [Piloderma croceum F 1598]
MIKLSSSSRQPIREAWTLERLNAELTINLGMAIDRSTHSSYTSVLNSYITFCRLHGFDIEPTPRTLALYVTFQSMYINPKSVDTYLSGICNQLEMHFPLVRTARQSTLVSRALQGAKRRFGVATLRKLPLTRNNLLEVFSSLGRSPSHDDLLFATQLFVGTDCLMRLAELTWPDKVSLRDYRKVTMRHSVQHLDNAISFWLPGHKADQYFEGNRLFIRKTSSEAYNLFKSYISSRDNCFRARPELWLRTNGTIPTRSWFIHRLRSFFPSSIGGQSMRASGATALAEAG